MITQMNVVFAGQQTLGANWFTFERLSPGAVPIVTANISQVGPNTVAVLTFSGAVELSGSLLDGLYRLTLNSAQITNPMGQAFDGDADMIPGGNFVFGFHRLFGDINGDRTVDGSTDFALFGAAFGLSTGQSGFTPAFDFNNDGQTDGPTDFAQFGSRFGITI